MKWCLILLVCASIATAGFAAADSPEDPEGPGPGYCIFIAPGEMPPIAIDLDNCEIPPPIPDPLP